MSRGQQRYVPPHERGVIFTDNEPVFNIQPPGLEGSSGLINREKRIEKALKRMKKNLKESVIVVALSIVVFDIQIFTLEETDIMEELAAKLNKKDLIAAIKSRDINKGLSGTKEKIIDRLFEEKNVNIMNEIIFGLITKVE